MSFINLINLIIEISSVYYALINRGNWGREQWRNQPNSGNSRNQPRIWLMCLCSFGSCSFHVSQILVLVSLKPMVKLPYMWTEQRF